MIPEVTSLYLVLSVRKELEEGGESQKRCSCVLLPGSDYFTHPCFFSFQNFASDVNQRALETLLYLTWLWL